MNGSYVRVKVDDLGRVTLPIDMRRILNINPHDKLRLYFDEEARAITLIKRDVTDVEKKISEVREIAGDSRILNVVEYEQLCGLLDKLGGNE